MTGASREVLDRVAVFRQEIKHRHRVSSISAIYHPDLEETWLHVRGHDGRHTTVSFCDDDPEGVYVVIRRPGERPRLAQGRDADILTRLCTDVALWPTS